MLAYLNGKILKKNSKGIILKVDNIGYQVFLSKTTLPLLEEMQELEVFIHHYIKEDISDLYGFTKFTDLEFFTKLININGIGPKVAQEILSADSQKIKLAIANEDEAFICKVPGIGKKTAKRLILELKDKIDIIDIQESPYENLQSTHNDALEALLKLGYGRGQILQTFRSLPQEIKEAEEIITYFLRNA
jgi:Holliday junction DNA helicase RuvA